MLYRFKGTFQGIPDLDEMDKFTKSPNIKENINFLYDMYINLKNIRVMRYCLMCIVLHDKLISRHN